MSEDDSRTFTLGSLEERTALTAAKPDLAAAPDAAAGSPPLVKVNRRITRVAFLLLLLMLAVGAGIYWDLRQQLRQRQDVELQEMTALVQQLRAGLEGLAQRLDAVESGLAESRQKTDKELALLRKEGDELQKRIQGIDVSGAVQKQQAALLAQVTAAQEPLQKEMKTLTGRVTALDARLNEFAGVAGSTGEKAAAEVAQLKKRLEQLEGQMVGKDQLNLEMLKLRKGYETQQAADRRELEKQIRAAQEQIARLESRLLRAPTPGAGAPSPTPAPRGGTAIQEQPLQ
jgi:hypothetical protein